MHDIGAALPLAGGAAAQAGGSHASGPAWAVFLAVALIVFLALRAFYAGSETALVSLNKPRMRRLADEGDRRARIILRLVDSPATMLGMTLVGTNLMSVVIAQVDLLFVWALLGVSKTMQQLLVRKLHIEPTMIATVSTTVLVLIFGEILPKTIFRINANQMALRYAFPLRASEVVLGIGVRLVTVITAMFVKLLGREQAPPSSSAVRAELGLLATMGEKSGTILSDQRRMIHGVLNLPHRTVAHVMRPLVDMVAVEKDTPIDEFMQVASRAGHTRIPVYEKRIFNVTGIVDLLDVIHSDGGAQTIEPFIRSDVQFVPESKPTGILLQEIQRARRSMVFVVDEYCGVVGLVTIADLVEEIVGDLSDERDITCHVRQVDSRTIECDGRAEINMLCEKFGVPVPPGNYETIAGGHSAPDRNHSESR